MIKITIKGIEEVKQRLEKAKEAINLGANQGIVKATLYMQGEVKSSIAGQRNEPTSVNTGRFLNSVDLELLQNKGIVFSQVPYAKYLEWGTSKIQPRRHFTNSLVRNKPKIKELIQSEIKTE